MKSALHLRSFPKSVASTHRFFVLFGPGWLLIYSTIFDEFYNCQIAPNNPFYLVVTWKARLTVVSSLEAVKTQLTRFELINRGKSVSRDDS